MNKIKRFTLIELLVVVAILGILASILLPSLKKARKTSICAVCTSNQKQIGIAFEMYKGSNDEYYPAGPAKVSWDDLLGDYDGRELTQEEKEYQEIGTNRDIDNSLYLCPASIQERGGVDLRSYAVCNERWPDDMSNPNARRGMGGWNDHDGDPNSASIPWSISTPYIASPTNFIVMAEFQYFENIMGFAGSGGVGYFPVGRITRDFSPVGLAGGAWNVKGGIEGYWIHDSSKFSQNFLFGDGHVEFKTFTSTLINDSHYFTAGNWIPDIKNTHWNALNDNY